jgi:serine phosphatase RsbU (regulator of sigma subunit)
MTDPHPTVPVPGVLPLAPWDVPRPLPIETLLPAASDEAFERFVRLVRAQLAVPVALVTLVSADEQVFPGAAGLPEPWQSTRRTPLTHSFCQHVVTAAEPLIVEDAREHPLVRDNLAIPDLHVVAYIGMPLTDADGRVIGSLCAIDDRPRRWSDRELAVLTDLADACSSEIQLRVLRFRATQAAEVAGVEWQRTAQLLEETSSVAETLQRAMLPQLPDPPGLQLAARYLPANSTDKIGGDWYDGFVTPDGTAVFAIGDVVGHDITAAADMSQLRTLLRGYAVDGSDLPATTMGRLDRALSVLPMSAIASIVLARIGPSGSSGGRRLCWTNAGHPPPLVLAPDGTVEILDTRPDMLVGIDPDRARGDHETILPAGGTLLLYTDGLIERPSTGRDIDTGVQLLSAALADQQHLAPDALLERVLRPVYLDRDDDVAVLAIRAA